MPTEWIHHPWDAPTRVLQAAGVELGLNYPKPIVDMSTAKLQLDEAITRMWEVDRMVKAKIKQNDNVDEGVGDNIGHLDLPRVVIRRKMAAACDSSSADQLVPSIRQLDNDDRRRCRIAAIESGTSKVDEDLRSTAESSSVRKRSISDSMCAVPASSSSQEIEFHASMRPCRDIRADMVTQKCDEFIRVHFFMY